MKIRYLAIIAAVVVMAVPLTLVGGSDEAVASESVGTTNFYYYTDTGAYTAYTSSGINASDALSSSAALLDEMGAEVDNDYSKLYESDYGDYTSINDEWGAITKTSGAVDGYVWNVYVYTYVDGEWAWRAADATLGFYKPFSDYSEAYATANVALYYGPETEVEDVSLPGESLQDLTEVTETSTFEVTFRISEDEGVTYTTAVGYGSDAALALIDAVGDDVSIDLTVGVSYGYVVYLNQLYTTMDEEGVWHWWNMYNNTLSDPDAEVYSSFYLGFYTPLSGFDLSSNVITFVYI